MVPVKMAAINLLIPFFNFFSKIVMVGLNHCPKKKSNIFKNHDRALKKFRPTHSVKGYQVYDSHELKSDNVLQ